MRVIFTGATGLLGTACRAAFEQTGGDFFALQRDVAWRMIHSNQEKELPRADVMIHAAANTDVEQCEHEPDACYRDNFLLTEGLAKICVKIKIPLVFMSSTGVYGESESIPYREYSKVCPTTHHHRAKWLGEQVVLASSHSNMVIRTGWLFGGNFENPKNFVARRLKEAVQASETGASIYSNSEQRGCPTYTADVAERLHRLVVEGHRGIFNVVNEGNASRLEYVRAILESVGSRIVVEPVLAAAFSRHAKVSSNEMALNWRATELGLPSMPNWRSSLERYIREICNNIGDSRNG